DVGQEDKALARFDELVLSPVEGPGRRGEGLAAGPAAPRPVRRRVRPNAATAHLARHDAAFAERDADAIAARVAEDYEVVDHPTGATFGRSGLLDVYRRQFRIQDLTRRRETLATLGDSLALSRTWWSGSGAGRTFDVGAFEVENITLVETDAQGRSRRVELFGEHKLGDAVVRLYERYAEILPEDPARAGAAATARSVSLMQGPWDLDRTRLFAAAVEVVDHRILGTWSARGAKATMEHVRSVLELADNVATRFDDVLGLRMDALLVCATHSGTARAGGGPYERHFVLLTAFAPDGLVVGQEYFDLDPEDQAPPPFSPLVPPAAPPPPL